MDSRGAFELFVGESNAFSLAVSFTGFFVGIAIAFFLYFQYDYFDVRALAKEPMPAIPHTRKEHSYGIYERRFYSEQKKRF